MQIWKFINMEPPSAAASHLKFAFFAAFRIHLYSETFIIEKKITEDTYRCSCPPAIAGMAKGSAQTMCRLWGYQSVPFIVLCRRDFYTNFFAFVVAMFPFAACKSGNLFASRKGRVFHHLATAFEESIWNIVNILRNMHHSPFFIAPGKPTRFAIVLNFPQNSSCSAAVKFSCP